MDRLPETPSGKVDRSALPKLAIDGLYRRAQYTSPRTDLEQELAAIWSEVLGLPRIGVHDNFFDLGGHSLLATQVVARVRRSYDIDLALRTFFEHATIEGLSLAVVGRSLRRTKSWTLWWPRRRVMTRFSDERLYRIVRNEMGRLAVWPSDRDLPGGWQPTGVRGRYDECIRHIGLEEDLETKM